MSGITQWWMIWCLIGVVIALFKIASALESIVDKL